MQIKKKMRFLICIFAVIISGCSNDHSYSDLTAFVNDIAARPKGVIEPLPEFKPYESFFYSATGLRSPFEKPVEIQLIKYQNAKAQDDIKPDLTRIKEYLEGFSIDSIKMVGTISFGDAELWALVDDLQAGVHRIKQGNYLGQNHGKVIAINQYQIDILELVPDGHGGWLERPRSLKLQDDL